MKTITTHNGMFHADEVLAIALLKAFTAEEFSIERTRDADIIAASDIAVDVGGIHSDISYTGDMIAYTGEWGGEQLSLDHHQHNKEDRNFGLSSAGLVLQFLQIRITDDPMAASHGYETSWVNLFMGEQIALVNDLVRIVDAHDTGVRASHSHPFIKAVSGMNSPSDINGEVQDENFATAVDYAVAVIKRLSEPFEWDTVESVSSNLMGGWIELCPACGCAPQASPWEGLYNSNSREKETLEKKIQEVVSSATPVEYQGVQVIVLRKDDPFIPVKRLIGLADLSVSWDNGQSCWTVQTVPLEEGEFGSKYTLIPTGADEEVFCHKGGFIGKYRDEWGLVSVRLKGEEKMVNIEIS